MNIPQQPTLIDLNGLPETSQAYKECSSARNPLQYFVKRMGVLEQKYLQASISCPSEALPTSENADLSEYPLLQWNPDPFDKRELLGTSKRAPDTTIYVIKLIAGRDDRGRMRGAFMSDQLERSGLYDNALVAWLKSQAEIQMREFIAYHANPSLRAELARYRQREKVCETMDQAEKLALIRAIQEIRDEVGLIGDEFSPRQIVEAVRRRLNIHP